MSGDFAEFYRGTFAELAGYGWSLTRDAQLGDDLAQEALTRVYARWQVLRQPRPYAYRIVTNMAHDRWRADQRGRVVPFELYTGASPGPDTGTLDAVRRLPAAQRDVVLLHYYADMPIADIATALRRPVGTIKRRLFDARASLAAALQEEGA